MFHKGDLVWIFPYDQVQEHYCIDKNYWNRVYANNPHIVRKASVSWFAINGYHYSWPSDCAQLEEKIISVPDVMSMV